MYPDCLVLLPYEITLFSNISALIETGSKVLLPYEITLFSNYSIKPFPAVKFYYLMKLHYSQTWTAGKGSVTLVLLPYEITLFSNCFD